MASNARYRVAVIGRGLIGSAAARHLSLTTGGIVSIGPDEPADRQATRDVFGSHYDEGRIFRTLDPDPIWARLAQRSIGRYAEIEAQSGVSFHREVGMLAVALGGAESHVDGYARTGDALGVRFDRLNDADLARRFPFLSFGAGATGAFEPSRAGHISPRRLVAAQSVAAERHGATLIREAAHRVCVQDGGVEITTASGQTVQAERALVATGGFANVHEVLPRPLDVEVKGRTVVLAEISDSLLGRLAEMPSLIVRGNRALGDPYILPPIRYPDGRHYIKLGTGELGPRLQTLDELGDWFRSTGGTADRSLLTEAVITIVPDTRGAPIHTDTCVVTATASGHPYVDEVVIGRLYVAVGGNGKAAKSSDEIGRLAGALALTGTWSDDLPRDVFKVRYLEPAPVGSR
ncbi:MAG: FAD-binding oxidoreductase [Chloroflexota bacterium]